MLEQLEKNYLTKKKRSLDFIEGPFEKLNDFKELNDFEQLQQEFPLDPVSEVKESVYVNDSEIDTEYDIKKLTKVWFDETLATITNNREYAFASIKY